VERVPREATPGAAAAIDPERILVSLVALGTVAALFLLRSLDDNRLTSWRWVFDGVNPAALFAVVLAGLLVAHLAPRVPVPPRAADAVLFALAFAAGACTWGAPEAVVDASRYFTQAKHLEVYGVSRFLAGWGGEIPSWTDLPLVPFLDGLALRASGESRAAIQALTTLLFAGSAVLTRRLGAALFGAEVGLGAGALLLAVPYLLPQVALLLVDVPTLFFVVLASLAVTRAFQDGGARRILLASVAVALALLSKWSAWLLLTALPVIGAVHRRERPGALRTGAAIALGAAALVAAVALPRRQAWAEQLALLASYQAPGLRRWGEGAVSTFLFQVHPFLTAAAVASAWRAARRRDARYAIVLWPVLLLAVLRVARARYWLPAMPMLAILGAYGLQAIGRREVRNHVVACAVATSLAVALFGYVPFLRRTSAGNLATAGAYLDGLEEPAVEVFALAGPEPAVNPAVSVPILDLFTRKRIVHRAEEPSPGELERARTSSLRFTWEYRDPPYYSPEGPVDAAVAVISDDLDRPLPERVARRLEGYRLARVFAADERVFRHRTLVAIYRATGAPPPGPRPR
jgi:4-amino-4-deoxy-L-arabinose transferase-like glycosyltransferase